MRVSVPMPVYVMLAISVYFYVNGKPFENEYQPLAVEEIATAQHVARQLAEKPKPAPKRQLAAQTGQTDKSASKPAAGLASLARSEPVPKPKPKPKPLKTAALDGWETTVVEAKSEPSAGFFRNISDGFSRLFETGAKQDAASAGTATGGSGGEVTLAALGPEAMTQRKPRWAGDVIRPKSSQRVDWHQVRPVSGRPMNWTIFGRTHYRAFNDPGKVASIARLEDPFPSQPDLDVYAALKDENANTLTDATYKTRAKGIARKAKKRRKPKAARKAKRRKLTKRRATAKRRAAARRKAKAKRSARKKRARRSRVASWRTHKRRKKFGFSHSPGGGFQLNF